MDSSTRRPLRVALTVALAVLIVPAITFANHQFSDVATGASYHDEVESLVGAGITSGCGTGTYCPGNAVTRGSMAQFLVRGLGVATAGYGELAASDSTEFYVATVEMHTGGLPGGTGYVTVDADLSVLDLSGFCPCGVIFSIEETTTKGAFGPLGTMGTSPVIAGGSAASGSVSWVFEVPTGTDVEFGLWAEIFNDGPMVSGGGPSTTGAAEPVFTGSITAEYSPFGTAGELPTEPLSLGLQDWSDRIDTSIQRRAQDD
jgi:S-layer homology domain